MKQNDSQQEQQAEYVKPMIVDYGDLETITAMNRTNDISDVPAGGNQDGISR